MADPIRTKMLATIGSQGTGVAAGVTVTLAAQANRRIVLEAWHGSGDLAATVIVNYTKAGVATAVSKRFTGSWFWDAYFAPGAIIGDVNTPITVVISASTANCELEADGFLISG